VSYRRRRLAASAILISVVLLGVLALGVLSGSNHPQRAVARPVVRQTTTASTTLAPTTTSTTDPGTLPQTNAEPPTDVASLMNDLAPLWTAIQTDDVAMGATVFFPRSAYLQMKTGAISAPSSDYQSRLVALFASDLATYQQALGTPPSSARLVSFEVNPALAHWVPPGACANEIGYWHLPNIRIVYSNGAQTSSFGVFSLISWRGVWYVVHLGPVPRSNGSGLLDLPESGAGAPGPGGGC